MTLLDANRTLFKSIFMGEATLAAGESEVTISTPTQRLDYVVVATPDWNSIVWVTAKSLTSFSLGFNTPAPAGGGTVTWAWIH